jgi:K(+)-stimulated pyrophosphate-energized sodium pump
MESLIIALAGGGLALLTAVVLAWYVTRQDQGNEEVREIGDLIRIGAMAFLKREYMILSIFVVAIFIILALFIDYNVLDKESLNNDRFGGFGIDTEGPWTALSYLLGAIGSALAGFIGMSIAVRANTRTATASGISLNAGLRVAFSAGSVMGLTVVGIGILGITALWIIFKDPTIVAGFGFGASSIALFARVGGGIFTKAADVGADLVGKVEVGIPEDDPRNPATIADNVGDNVGDVAGMGADLFESYVGSMISALALATVALTGTLALSDSDGNVVSAAKDAAFSTGSWIADFDSELFVLPMLIGAIGILASILGNFLVRAPDGAGMSRLLWTIRTGIFGAGALALIGTAVAIAVLDLDFKLFWVVLTGLVAGQVIGTATEYFTSYENKPVQWIASQSPTGAGSVIIAGVAIGMFSTVVPAASVAAAIYISNELAGVYGIALAAVGMLSTLGITLATDAYGPVADNAGGIAEQAHLDPQVRERTDALDALGNTTAATGKGFAIGSAVLTALALMVAYGEVAGVDVFRLNDPDLVIGLIIGGVLPFLFAGLTMKAVGDAANDMIEEVRRQFREIPGLREGLPGVKPDAARAVDISTQGSLKAMILPGLIAVISPVLVGAVLGPEVLGGLLLGSIITGFFLAVFMANAGGAWDNAKKYVELGNYGGKGSDAHAAAVTGDTVGDPFKDTSGPALNILLKLMAVVSLIFGPLFI